MAQLVAGREEDFEAVRETAAFKVDAIGEEMKMKMLEKISREYKKRNHKGRERERDKRWIARHLLCVFWVDEV